MDKMQCPKCGETIPAEAQFCPFCGASVQTPSIPVASNPAVQQTATPPPSSNKELIIGLCCAIGAILIAVVVVLLNRNNSTTEESYLEDTIAYEVVEEEPALEAVKLRLDNYQRATYGGWTYNFSNGDARRTNNTTGEVQKMTEYFETNEAWIIGDYLLLSGSTGDWGNCMRINLTNFRKDGYFGSGAEVSGNRVILHYLENVQDDIWAKWQVSLSLEDFVSLTCNQINHRPHEHETRYQAENHWGDEYGESEYGYGAYEEGD